MINSSPFILQIHGRFYSFHFTNSWEILLLSFYKFMGNSTTLTFLMKNDGKFYSFHFTNSWEILLLPLLDQKMMENSTPSIFFVKISMIFCLVSLLMHFQLFLRNAHCFHGLKWPLSRSLIDVVSMYRIEAKTLSHI